jgi:Sulfotransferase family
MHTDTFYPIFIIGCARSGTTWLGRILGQGEGLNVTIENPIIFPLVDEAVLYWVRRDELVERLISIYRTQISKAGTDVYVDKSHQNIWLVELIDQAFPAARYVAIERQPYATIASMMRHSGVRRHFIYWRNYPLPNRHLGIRESDAPHYDALPLSIKCAFRWQSHQERLIELRARLGDRLHFIRYERLVEDTEAEIERLSAFVGRPLRTAAAELAPLIKWRTAFSMQQRARIDEAIAERGNGEVISG